MISISRRRFLALTGGLLATGCAPGNGPSLSRTDTTSSAGGSTSTTPATTPTSTTLPTSSVVTTVTTPADLVSGDRVIVMVELAGGNDAINTLVPTAGAYRDARPTIAIAEDQLLAADGLAGYSLHPSLGALVPYFDAGAMSIVAGVGFPDPDRSHFVSTDRWLRADRMDETLGWLGRWIDQLPDDVSTLGATSLGGNGRMLLGAERAGTVIDAADAFALPAGLSHSVVRSIASPADDDELTAAAKRSIEASVGAIEEFDAIADAVRARVDEGSGYVRLGGAFSTGLAVAAELILGDVGTRVVTVSGNGFDTHGEQVDLQADLLSDLATGLDEFWKTLEAAGASDRVLLVTHSEFGRRVDENGSGGTDHGAAGLSFVMGSTVTGGLHGAIDLGNLLDGDLRPVVDPRTMYTAVLDWVGGDVERILGQRYDEFPMLASV